MINSTANSITSSKHSISKWVGPVALNETTSHLIAKESFVRGTTGQEKFLEREERHEQRNTSSIAYHSSFVFFCQQAQLPSILLCPPSGPQQPKHGSLVSRRTRNMALELYDLRNTASNSELVPCSCYFFLLVHRCICHTFRSFLYWSSFMLDFSRGFSKCVEMTSLFLLWSHHFC